MDKLWLPKGHTWDLHIEHDRLDDAGVRCARDAPLPDLHEFEGAR